MMTYFIDLDGTLIDSRRRVFELFTRLTGDVLTFDQYWEIKREGKSNHDILQQQSRAELFPDFKEKWFNMIECPELLIIDSVIPNTLEALARIQEQGNEIVLVTSRQSVDLTKWQLSELKLASFFSDFIITEHKRAKSEALKDWLNRSAHAAKGGYLIGDTEEDFHAGINNNLCTVGVLTGFRSATFLKKLPFTRICSSLHDFSKSRTVSDHLRCQG